MSVKDKLFVWLIRNLILPQRENISDPGFIKERIGNNENREIFFFESFLSSLEKTVNKEILYYIGKKYGYTYSNVCKFPTFKKKIEDIENFIYFLVRSVESIYASGISHKLKINKKIFALKMRDYIVCSKNGLGYIFSEGGIAGIWAYACQDLTIEAVQPKC